MGFQKGGELFTHLRKVKRFPESQVKFYTSQFILAIGHLHGR
jgi:serum/glucocorticoid-regulated kinase 2